ncbi:hypothetical protein AC578_2834 [Pseudocercospora eumusae]|uniref:Uncharacterized protein n=1 Tax=Pseudocercospora eumusae TaxID=321146 RepID=A0A139H432_9PEZI|nr:hypothetical protein AC578_2834 [Pseudocercospora eumusae]
MANRRDKEERSRGRSAVQSNRVGIPSKPTSIFGLDPKLEPSQTFDPSPEISGRRSTSRHIPNFRRASSSPPSTSPVDSTDARSHSHDRRSPTFGRISLSPTPNRLPETSEPLFSPRHRSDTLVADYQHHTPGAWRNYSTPPAIHRVSSNTNTSGPAAVKSRDIKVPKSSGNQLRSSAIAWFLLALLLPCIAVNGILSWVAIGADARCIIAGECKPVQLLDAAIAANVTGSRASMCTKFGEAMRSSKELEQSWELIDHETENCPGSLLAHPLVRDVFNHTCNLRCEIELNFARAVPGDAEIQSIQSIQSIHFDVANELSPLKWSWSWWRKVFVVAIQNMMGGDGRWLQEGHFKMNSSSALYQRSISSMGVRLQRFVLKDPVARWAVEFDAATEGQAGRGSEAVFYLDAVLSLYRMEGNGRDVGLLGELLVKDPDAGYLAGFRVTPACTPRTLAMKVQAVGYEAQAAARAAVEAVTWWESGTRIMPVNAADVGRPRRGMMRSGAMQLVRASVEQPEVTREWMRNQELRLAHRMGKDMCPLIAKADGMCWGGQGCDIGGGRR